jgi:hypothetical protein
MNSARAREQGTDAGQPPDKQRRIAQSIGYVCARLLVGSEMLARLKTIINGEKSFMNGRRMLEILE